METLGILICFINWLRDVVVLVDVVLVICNSTSVYIDSFKITDLEDMLLNEHI